jgi:hypothetical protein
MHLSLLSLCFNNTLGIREEAANDTILPDD